MTPNDLLALKIDLTEPRKSTERKNDFSGNLAIHNLLTTSSKYIFYFINFELDIISLSLHRDELEHSQE